MSHETGTHDRWDTAVVAWTTAKRAMRSATGWGLLFGALVFNEMASYHNNFPTMAARENLAHAFGGNAAFTALMGPARRLDTVGGWVAWRVFVLLITVGAIWGLLTATRLLRREEDAGRWELLLAGRTSRRHATAQALAGLAAGWAVLWALTAVFTVLAGSRSGVGISAPASLFYATAATASAAMFLAIGALASQLTATRRQASGLAAAIYAAAFLIRTVADSFAGLAWLRWASPLGWVESLHPLTSAQPLALVPIAGLTASAAVAAVVIAGHRDLGAAVLARHRPAQDSTRLLGGAAMLVVRLERWAALAWIGGIALLALIFGMVARSAAGAHLGAGTVERQVARLGGHQGGATAAWIGYEFAYLAALVAFAAATQISATRGEEADGRVDNLLARHLHRGTWLAGRLGFGVALVLSAGLATGVGGWLGAAARHGGIGLAAMSQTGLNVAIPGLFILGVGTLLYGVTPRFAASALYVLVLWSFLVEIIGTSITSNHWLLDTTVLTHLGPVPATSLRWTAIAWLTGLGAAAALAGLAAFGRRDLAAA